MGESEVANAWRAEGKARGSLRTMRTALFQVLALRWGPPLPGVVSTMESTTSLDELSRWHRAAVAAASLDDFLATIRA
jgi:hypothetical protein